MQRQRKPKKENSGKAATRIAAEDSSIMFGAEATIYISEQFSSYDEDECVLEIKVSAAEVNDEDRSITISYTSNFGRNTESHGRQTLRIPQLHADRIPDLLRKLEDQTGAFQAIEHIEGCRPTAQSRARPKIGRGNSPALLAAVAR